MTPAEPLGLRAPRPGVGAAIDGPAAEALGASSMTAISVPTVTVAPSFTLISRRTPASGAGL